MTKQCETTKKSPESGIANTIILTCDVARPTKQCEVHMMVMVRSARLLAEP